MAYLTDNESATNTFTVGKVQIDLEEPAFPGNDDPSVKNMVPNQEVAKDPKVENTGSNEAIVFMEVSIPKATIKVAADDGTVAGDASLQDIFKVYSGETEGFNQTNFIEIKSDTTGTDKNTYVFAYNKKLAVGASTEALFDKVKLQNIVEGQIASGVAQNIDVKAYAIQANEIANVTLGDAFTDTDKDALTTVYNVYMKQNENSTTKNKPADTSNAKDLAGNDRTKVLSPEEASDMDGNVQ